MNGSALEKITPLRRTAPHDPDVELAALASATCSREGLAELLNRLTIEQFYVPANQLLFACFQEVERQGKPLELIGFTDALRGGFAIENLPLSMCHGRLERNSKPVITLEEVGGVAYVTNLFAFVPTSANLGYYIDIIREKFLARTVIRKCTELVRVAYEETSEIKDVLEATQHTLTEIIMEAENPSTFRTLADGVSRFMEKLQYACDHYTDGITRIDGVATGFVDFDRCTHGLQPGQLIINGARPAQGKTALMGNMATNMAKNGVRVGIFSLEMTYDDLIERIFSAESGITINKIRSGGRLTSEEFATEVKVGGPYKTATRMVPLPILVDDTPALSTTQFKARARLMKLQHNVQVIFVDYLQLMHSLTRRAQESRWIEVTEISGTLKAVAKELMIPVIACCQLNREAEARDASFCKPKLSDLRESGAIEQDADIVTMLWRPERHLAPPKFSRKNLAKLLGLRTDCGTPLWGDEEELKKKNEDLITLRNCQIDQFAGLHIVKHRNGPPAEIRLRFLGEKTLFQSTTKEIYSSKKHRQHGHRGEDQEEE